MSDLENLEKSGFMDQTGKVREVLDGDTDSKMGSMLVSCNCHVDKIVFRLPPLYLTEKAGE